MRDFKWDKPKSQGQLKKELGKTCSIDGCTNPLTHMEGPGSEVLCRDHQLKQREYGGTGRIDRPHTFHRKFVCDDCGKDVTEEVDKKYPNLKDTDPKLFNRLCRNRVIGDHIIRRSDGGSDSEDNIQTLCLDCNSDKTIINEDYRAGNKSKLNENS
jgi:5-methylcytosine-specific restriction endonuclease McrA